MNESLIHRIWRRLPAIAVALLIIINTIQGMIQLSQLLAPCVIKHPVGFLTGTMILVTSILLAKALKKSDFK